MTEAKFDLIASSRDDQGKGASRRLRHAHAVPAIVYGGSEPARSISLEEKELVKRLENEAFFSHIIDLSIDGKVEKVVLKALQRHPVKNSPMHADFLRVTDDRYVTVRVPLHFKNVDSVVGVRTQGGRLSILMNEVVVRTLPATLPAYLDVDLANLQAGSALLLSDLPLPEGVSIPMLAKPVHKATPVAKVRKPRGGAAN